MRRSAPVRPPDCPSSSDATDQRDFARLRARDARRGRCRRPVPAQTGRRSARSDAHSRHDAQRPPPSPLTGVPPENPGAAAAWSAHDAVAATNPQTICSRATCVRSPSASSHPCLQDRRCPLAGKVRTSPVRRAFTEGRRAFPEPSTTAESDPVKTSRTSFARPALVVAALAAATSSGHRPAFAVARRNGHAARRKP
jgi:hypothetical protein